MDFQQNERSVSELFGALLIFGLLVLLLVLAQVSLVPTLNQQAEFEHSLRTFDDVQAVQSGVFRIAATGAPETTDFEAGLTYPSRPLLINPGPVQGVVETVDAGSITISNVRSDNDETDDYWTGLKAGTDSYESRTLRYNAQYNEFRNPGTYLIENGVVFKQFENDAVVAGEQRPLINGNRITILVIDGEYQDITDGTTSLSLTPISAPSKSISVSDDGNGPITITAETSLTTDQWRQILANEPNVDPNDVNVDANGILTIELQEGVTYDLRMAKVGIGNGVDQESAAYVTREGVDVSVIPVGSGKVSVEVRDRFNNPVIGEQIDFEITPADPANSTASFDETTASVLTTTATTDQNGLATVKIYADGDETISVRGFGDFDGGTDTIDEGDGDVVDPFEEIVFDVQIGSGGGTPTGPADNPNEINPNAPGKVVLRSAVTQDSGGASQRNWLDFTLENTNTATDANVEQIRINFFSPNGQGRSGSDPAPDYAVIETPASAGNKVLEVTGPYVTITAPDSLTIEKSTTETIRIQFFEGNPSQGLGGTPYEVYPGDTVMFTVIYDVDTAIYLVVPAST